MEQLSEKVCDLDLNEGGRESTNGTGLVYDSHMTAHMSSSAFHPECPQRITSIWAALQEKGIVGRCSLVKPREATKDEILAAHSEDHYDNMMKTVSMSDNDLHRSSLRYNSIYINKDTFSCALLSAGCCLEIIDQVLSGKLRNGIAVVRPPGHHASEHSCSGFCFFNNIAMATKMALKNHSLQRVLIVDWDVHHGDGTQKIFWDDKRVLLVSLHRYDDGRFYPGSIQGNHTAVGGEEAQGFSVNVAWNDGPMGDAEYLSAFHQIVLPMAYEFNPELVLVSCGFDAAKGDPLGGYEISPTGYAHMTHLLKGLANGRVVLALEGGYNLDSISDSMCACASVLLGDPVPPMPTSLVPSDAAIKCISSTISTHSKYWKNLRVHSSGEQQQQQEQEHTRGDACLGARDESTPGLQDGASGGGHQDGASGGGHQDGASGGGHQEQKIVSQDDKIKKILEDADATEMFAVTPKRWCEHLPDLQPLPPESIASGNKCEECGVEKEVWVCLCCYHYYCGRYINQHMVSHTDASGHTLALSMADLSVWCFPCDSYLDNQVLQPAISAAHRSKFGVDMHHH